VQIECLSTTNITVSEIDEQREAAERLESSKYNTNLQRKLPSNSLTPRPSKLLEFIVTDQVKDYLISLGVPNNHQLGFREKRSCLTNLLTSEEWTKPVDERHALAPLSLQSMNYSVVYKCNIDWLIAVEIVILEIAKVFDTITDSNTKWDYVVCMGRYWAGCQLFEQKQNERISQRSSIWVLWCCQLCAAGTSGSIYRRYVRWNY